MVDLDRADVGQAVGGLRARTGAELAGSTGDQGIGAGERRVGDVVAQRDDPVGIEQAAAGRGVDRSEDGGSRLVLAVAGDRPFNVAAEDIGGKISIDPKTLWPLLKVMVPTRSGPLRMPGPATELPATMLLAMSNAVR